MCSRHLEHDYGCYIYIFFNYYWGFDLTIGIFGETNCKMKNKVSK